MQLRKTLLRFFDVHELAWEIFMVALAIVFVVIGFLPDFAELSEDSLGFLDGMDIGITVFFALEFVTRLLIAPSRKVYFKEHWLDMIAIIPFVRWFRIFRVVRILRLLRLVRMVKVLNSIDYFEVNISRFARLNGMGWMLLTLTVVMLVSSALLFFFEQPVNDKVQTYWDALYASLVTWTTPGYGDIIPVTTNGRLCGLVLIISGLVTWGILIANLAAFLASRRTHNCGNAAISEVQEKLTRLDKMSREELIALRGAVTALIDDSLEDGKDE